MAAVQQEVGMAAALVLVERRIGPVTVIELAGRLIVDEGDRRFSEQIAVLVSAGNLNLLVDLRNVTYIDSGGVGALVAMYLHVFKRGGRLKLLRPTERVRRVLEITGLLSVFEVFEEQDEGVRSFAMPSVMPDYIREQLIAR
jgi:anti-sigma B factor antagonist